MKPETEKKLVRILVEWNYNAIRDASDAAYRIWTLLWDERPVSDNALRQAWNAYYKRRLPRSGADQNPA